MQHGIAVTRMPKEVARDSSFARLASVGEPPKASRASGGFGTGGKVVQ
jgi:hypothetical protein